MRNARVAAAGLIALAVAMGIGRFAFTPILPMMREDAGVSVAAGGWLAAANYLGYLIGALSATRVPLSASTAIRLGLATIAATTLAMGATTHLGAWLLLRGLAGVASAWVLIHVSAWCLDRLSAARKPGLGGVVFAGVGTGIALAGFACLVLMQAHARSATAWITLGVAAVALTALAWPVFAPDGDERSPRTAPARSSAPAAGALRLVLCYGAFGFGYIIPATFLPVMARDLIADPAVFGWAWPVFGVAAAVSPVVAAWWSDARRVWIVAQFLMAAGVAMPIVSPGIAGIVFAACAVGGTFVVITMAGMQEARRVAGAAAPRLMAAMTAAFATGQIVGPLLVSAAVGVGLGFAPALILAALSLVVSAVVLGSSAGGR
jgi:MFS family permease